MSATRSRASRLRRWALRAGGLLTVALLLRLGAGWLTGVKIVNRTGEVLLDVRVVGVDPRCLPETRFARIEPGGTFWVAHGPQEGYWKVSYVRGGTTHRFEVRGDIQLLERTSIVLREDGGGLERERR